MRVVKATYREFRGTALLGAIALVVGQLLALMVPKYVGLAIDSIRELGALTTSERSDIFSRGALWLAGINEGDDGATRIQQALILLVTATVVAALFQFFKRWTITGLSRRVEFNLRQRIFSHLQVLPLDFYSRMRSGDVISRATSDIEAVRMMTGPALMYLGEAITMLPLTLMVMYFVSPTMTLCAMVPLVLLSLSTVYFSPRQRIYSMQVQEAQGELSARAQENFSGVRVVKAFNREDFESAQFDELGQKLYRSQIALARNRAGFQASIWTLNGIGLLIFLYVGARELADGTASLGALVEFMMYFTLLYWPMIALGWVVSLVIRGRVSAKRIDHLLHTAPDEGVVAAGHDASHLTGRIRFEGVGFSYVPNVPVLQDISFEVHPGKTLGVVGPVGCGKSTLASLLLRLREADKGSITLDDRPIHDYAPGKLREQIGFVPQETFLFSESIADNIAFGVDRADPGDVAEAAELAQLANDVEHFPNQYDTLLGERGVNLSGGQKQRTAIARALIKQPRIVVLDDCLSAVDTRTEEAILRGLKEALRDTTNIIIAQRVSAISHADEIIVLDEGRIVERGTDRELRAQGGLYADMAQRQSLEASLSE